MNDPARKASPARVLVAGASGFLGSWLCRSLSSQGRPVIGAVRSRPKPDSLFVQLGLEKSIALVEAGTLDLAGAVTLIEKTRPDLIFNLIGQSQIALSVAEPAGTVCANTHVGWALCEAARMTGRPIRFVQASTDALYPPMPRGEGASETTPADCTNVYEASKAALDLLLVSYARTFGMPIAIARLGNIYGPGDAHRARIIPSLLHAIATGEPPLLRGGGRAVRSLLYVDDAITGLELIAEAAAGKGQGEIINLSGPQPLTILEIARNVLAAAGASHLEPRVEDDAPGSVSIKFSSSAKALRLLGWTAAATFEDGLAATIAWDRSHRQAVASLGPKPDQVPANG